MASADENEHLAAMLEAAHRETLNNLEGVDHNRVVYEDGGWTVQDVIGHLVAWEAQGLAALQAHKLGVEYHANYSFDSQLVYQETKDDEAQRLYAEWEAVRELLRATIIDMPTDRLLMTMHSPWGEYGHVHKLVGDMIAYQREHIDAILRSSDKRAS